MEPGLNGQSWTLDTLARDVRTLIDQVGRPPSPATGDPGSGMLRALSELIARDTERETRRAIEEERVEKSVALRGWVTSVGATVAAVATVYQALRH